VRFLTPDVAIMHSVGGTILAGQSDIESERNSVHTIVAKKDDVSSQWRIVAFQNTRAQYIGRPDMVQALTEDLQSNSYTIQQQQGIEEEIWKRAFM
jgi:hypothetical protein